MSAASDVRKNFSMFVDGRGMAGQVEEFNAPELVKMGEEYRGGGMVAPVFISMGLEALTASFSLIKYDRDTLALFGVVAGKQANFIGREVLESHDGTIKGVVHTMRGEIKSLKPGSSKAGEKALLEVEVALTYYKLEHSGQVVQEIDVENMVHIVGGVDQLAQQRSALGM